MNAMPKPELAMLLLRARESAFGISVVTNNPRILGNRLKVEKRNLGFDDLLITQPSVDSESRIWIVRKDARPDGEEEN